MVHRDISHHFISSNNFSVYCQCLTVCFHTSPVPTYITLVYRSPNCDRSSFHNALIYVSDVLKEDADSVVLGDFNFPTIKWTTTTLQSLYGSAREFHQFCVRNSLDQLVVFPTHNLNILDLVLTNNANIVQDLKVLIPFSTSDHRTVSFTLVSCHAKPNTRSVYRDYKNADYTAICNHLICVNWRELLKDCKTSDECY